jgi:hypothetical protein
MKTLASLAAVLAVCWITAVLTGCATSDPPTAPEIPETHYFARTSPDSVIANLRLAYQNKNRSVYLDCLAEEFVFHPSESTLAEYEWLPESWGKDTEDYIHAQMFHYGSFFQSIALELLQDGDPVEVPGPDPDDPIQYEYTFDVDLRVDCPDSVQYIATAPSLFVLRVDPLDLSPTGDDLWEIIEWYDTDEDGGCGRPVMPTSWGALKAIFLVPF